ncbi:MAG: hypothetical protein JO110_22220 [Acetobacteraceae bacterium]|nr:hypothetical protein [Acetobacteraceae bacterium]
MSQARIRAIAESIQNGSIVAGATDTSSPGLKAIIAAFRDAANSGATAEACSQAALAAVRGLPAEEQPTSGCPNDSSDGVPITQVSPMLDAASRQQIAGTEPEGKASEPIEAALLESIAACESLGGVGELAARATALRIIGERDQALREIAIVEPPAMMPDELVRRLGVMLARLEQVRASRALSLVPT